MVLTLIEHADGEIDETSLEMLTLARDLAEQVGEDVTAAMFGGEDLAADLGEYGVDTAYVCTGELAETYAPEARAEALGALCDDLEPAAIFGGGTDTANEVLAHLGAKRDLPMAANTTEIETDGETCEIERHRWGGSLIEHATMEGETKLFTTPDHELPIEPVGDGEAAVETLEPELSEGAWEVKVDRFEESDLEGVPLPEARIVVGGGRGVGGEEDFEQLEELADLFDNATVGATRIAVDEGWRPHNDQIGQTGQKIAPELYIAAGISGAVQHWVGAKGSENVLAINTDPEAAIMYKGDYAIVGDLHEVVPELIDAVEAAK
ncbi:electron transfer flavoprotein subunit alpha [Halodesulfurarchaeum formicicum]|uniref:Electron transfer flavoprotein subunit alpha n=1 Tax=Halodesulfurarchaeum formicicum TaxID=1873524 RepID=A0A1D8S6C5_9EURY|nr:electron transfer flavoprotein subunit alpha/FixB family protein [Halodesulfurarchaeum formicicum]AOW80917.1 electron transfer flavoprotein subunit alpha [Halodesulfurarchaeum formicicum]